MGTYNFFTTPDQIAMSAAGVFSAEDERNYFNDFKMEARKVIPERCVINLDGRELAVMGSAAADVFRKMMEYYKESGFKKVRIRVGDNPVLKLQIKMLAAKGHFTDYEFI